MTDWDHSRPFEALITRGQHHVCRQQGRLFETACREKYDMNVFVPTFMRSDAAAGLDADYDRYQWMGNAYILEDVSARHGIGPVRGPAGEVGEPQDGADCESCYWMGYTYRWWHYYTKQSSREIYACADYETMCRAYPGYHTLSCTMAVDKLMEDLPDPGPQSTWGSREAFETSRNYKLRQLQNLHHGAARRRTYVGEASSPPQMNEVLQLPQLQSQTENHKQ